MATQDENYKDLLKKAEKLEKLSKDLQKQTDKTSSAYRDSVRDLKQQTAEMETQIKKAQTIRAITEDHEKQLLSVIKKQQGINGNLAAALSFHKQIRGTFKEHLKDMVGYLGSVGAWFSKGEEIAENYYEISKTIGLSTNATRGLSYEFRGAVANVMRMGGELGDIRDIGQSFAETTGRQRIVNAQDVINIEKIAKGANLYSTEAAKLYEAFDFMGISGEKTYDYINKTFGVSQKIGLNSTKVIKVLEQNMKTMQGFSFRDGVKGMMQMSKLAVKMRLDVGSMLQMADKFYEPDAAIEAAAQLQLMGGDIAAAFGDPFTIMYEARNKPEELAKRVAKMTENMVMFNEKSGEYEILPEARQQLKFVGDQLGFSVDQMTEMARQSSKIKDIKMDVNGSINDPDIREAIAGMARRKDGKWVVDVQDQYGKRMSKSLDQLSEDEALRALDRKKSDDDKSDGDWLKEIAMHTQTFTEQMTNVKESLQYGLAADSGTYEIAMTGFLQKTIDTYEVTSRELVSTLLEVSDLPAMLTDAFKIKGDENIITDMIRNTLGSFDKKLMDTITGGEIKAETVLIDAKNFVLDALKGNDVVMGAGSDKAILYNQGSLGFGALGLNTRDSVVAGTDLWGPVNADLSNITTNAATPTKTTHNVNMSLNGDLTMNGAQLLTLEQKELVGKIVSAKIVEEATDQTAYNGLKPSGAFAGQ